MPETADETRYSVVPQTEGRPLRPLGEARTLELSETFGAWTFRLGGREYFVLPATAQLFRVADEHEAADVLFPARTLGRPKEGVPLTEVVVLDIDVLSINQRADATNAREAYLATRR